MNGGHTKRGTHRMGEVRVVDLEQLLAQEHEEGEVGEVEVLVRQGRPVGIVLNLVCSSRTNSE